MRALGVFAEMKQGGLEPDAIARSVLISACEKAKDVESSWYKALEIFAETQRRGLEPNAVTCGSHQRLGKAKKLYKAFEVFVDMMQSVMPDVITYTVSSTLTRRLRR